MTNKFGKTLTVFPHNEESKIVVVFPFSLEAKLGVSLSAELVKVEDNTYYTTGGYYDRVLLPLLNNLVGE